MKKRVIQAGAEFFPQFKPGWLWRWRFYVPNADTSLTILQVWIETFDPSAAAKFTTEEEAARFIERVDYKVDEAYRQQDAKRIRESEGVRIDKVIPK